MSGWIRLWRKMRENRFWQERRRFSKAEAWLDLLMEAAYADHEQLWRGLIIPVRRGQYLTTQVDLATRWKWDRKTVRVFLGILGVTNAAAIRTSKETETGYTLITILNYERYQGDEQQSTSLSPASDSPSDSSSDSPSTPHPLPTTEEGKEGKEVSPASGLTLKEYLEKLSPESQTVLHQIVSVIASTRRSGRVAQSVLDSLASKLSRYPQPVVLEACQIYLSKNYAAEGKREQYLLGIVRGEAKRQDGNGREPSSPFVGQKGRIPTPVAPAGTPPGLPYPHPGTEGQRVINRAWLEQQREHAR